MRGKSESRNNVDGNAYAINIALMNLHVQFNATQSILPGTM